MKDKMFYSYEAISRLYRTHRNDGDGNEENKLLKSSPLVSRDGFRYTADDTWESWIGRMNTYEFTKISFLFNGEMERRVFPNSTPGIFVVNAFTQAQAIRILLTNIRCKGSESRVKELPSNVEGISFETGRTWMGFDTGNSHEYSDCDPRTWRMDLDFGGNGWEHNELEFYNVAARYKLAIERDLYPYTEKKNKDPRGYVSLVHESRIT